jgi:acyl carrier protein
MTTIEELIREVLALSPDVELTDTTTPADISAWDSLGHINIIIAIEEEFDLDISPEQIGELQSIADFKALIRADAP